MKWLNGISDLSLLGFSVFIFILSLKLGIGKIQSPGPGFMPSVVSVILFFLSLCAFVSRVKEPVKDEGKGRFMRWDYLRKPFALLAALIGYALVLDFLGYVISAFLLMFMLFVIAEPQRWRKDLAIAAIVAALSYIVFNRWLGVQLPTGIFP
ncbi:MAG: tripartite tricarboxylate transporter TctB family protein [Deltaproteobacteria bacterium]